MVDDGTATVSLPEVPLLGVLPGTGGLTRLTDKRKMRRDLADVFCTMAEGVRADRARDWRLVDPIRQARGVRGSLAARARRSARRRQRSSRQRQGHRALPLQRAASESGYAYSTLAVTFDADQRVATLTLNGADHAGRVRHQIDRDRRRSRLVAAALRARAGRRAS